MIRIGRIPYINCYPVYHAIDRGIVPLEGEIVTGVPTALNRLMSEGALDVSVVSVVEYAQQPERYFLLPELAISCDGPVRSVMLFSRMPAEKLGSRNVIVSRSSMTSVAMLGLLFKHVWRCQPVFTPGDAELADIAGFESDGSAARLVIGDAALHMSTSSDTAYQYRYDLGEIWKSWTGLPFVFAVWVASRIAPRDPVLAAHRALLDARAWGIRNIAALGREAELSSGVPAAICESYLEGLDYNLSLSHLEGMLEFFRRLALEGLIREGEIAFLPAA